MMPSIKPRIHPSVANDDGLMDHLHRQAETYVERASQMANEIIAKNQMTVYEGPVIIREYHYYNDPYWCTSFDNRCSSQKKKDNEAGVAVIAGVVGAFALYLMAKSYYKCEDATSELIKSKEFKQEILENLSYDKLNENSYLIEVMKVAEVKEKMCTRIKTSSSWDIALRASLATSSFFTVGSYFLSTPLMPYGVCSAAASGVAMLVKYGFDNSEEKNGKDALLLQELISQLPKAC